MVSAMATALVLASARASVPAQVSGWAPSLDSVWTPEVVLSGCGAMSVGALRWEPLSAWLSVLTLAKGRPPWAAGSAWLLGLRLPGCPAMCFRRAMLR